MTQSWLSRTARLSGKAGRQGGVAGRVGWQALPGRVGRRAEWDGGQGLVAGWAGGMARWDGRQGGRRRVDLWSKECSGVNILT